MATDVDTDHPLSPIAPGPADDGSGRDGGGRPTDDAGGGPSAPETPAPPPTVWQELGYATPEDLRNTHRRYQDQIRGREAEKSRYERELAERDRRLSEYERPRQSQPPGEPPPLITIDQAMEAYLNGDHDTARRYQEQERLMARQDALQIQAALLTQAGRTPQYQTLVTTDHPDLANAQTPLYRAVYDEYASYASAPSVKFKYPEDPTAFVEAPSPDGRSAQRVDLRIVHDLAWKLRAERSFEDGRRTEARAARSPNALGPGNPPAAAAGAPGPLIYEDEAINNPQVRATLADLGWGKDVRTQHKKFWDRLDPKEKQRRLALHAAGQWTGRRG